MTRIKDFDLLNTPLEGTNLIDASAGTGKTYTITGLFLRLVLEKNLSVDEILVVTFTEAATEELKDRIRKQLWEAVEVFQSPNLSTISPAHSEDAFMKELVRRTSDFKTALRRLKEALRAFDQAAIFTIHGFCGRMLYENAFECGSLFDTELVTDQQNLIEEIVDDFWRRHFYNASPLFVHYAINNKVRPDSLVSLLANRVGQPYLKIIPRVEVPDSSQQEREFKEAFDEICNGWQSEREKVEDIFSADEGLNRTRYKKVNIPIWLNCMDDYVASEGHGLALFKGFEKFTSSEIKRAVKKNHVPPAHPLFDLCEMLKEKHEALKKVFEQRILGLKAELFNYAQNELSKRKEEKNIQSFDDLLLKLHRALDEKGGDALARAMRMKFKAALIDEFQDTDPIQYAIFKKVFNTKGGTLFLIGDPKQAIYGFRGADIFAYMEASGDVKSRYTLGENWRSEPDLITAINTIFANARHPFIYDKIPFQPTAPAPEKDPEFFRIEGRSEPPLQLWFYTSCTSCPDAGKPITKTKARELIPEAISAEISRLLSLGRNNKVLMGKRPLKEEDIAVLVRTNAEARLMQQALSALDIPSVLWSTGNIFDSLEAMEIGRVLAGISEPNRENMVKAALATDMIGVKGEELDGLMADETGWEAWLVKFKRYHDMWDRRGFIRMFRYLLLEEKILTRLMKFPDGERRNTNLLHLSEILHQASIETRLGMTGILKWLLERRDSSTPRLEEHQLRLETDENAVRLVTIHKSKGLEYPVVFCPFAWGGSGMRRSNEPFTFHDEKDNMRLTLDLGSSLMDENRLFAEKEALAEHLRLLYVALTRAKNRCYLVWGRFKDAETSAPAYLLHQPESSEGANIVSATGERFNGLSDEDMLAELKAILAKAGGTISLSEIPAEAEKEPLRLSVSPSLSPFAPPLQPLTCRRFTGKIDRSWQISSFSSLVSGHPYSSDMADRDAIYLPATYDQTAPEQRTAEEVPSGIFAFPRGTKPGTFLHDIFEHLDFAQKDMTPMQKLVADKLKEYGFELTWQETLCNMIRNVLSVPLEPSRIDFTLSRIENKDRINELEFYFPLKSISPKKLTRMFQEYAGHKLPADFPERIERLRFSPVRGFMKGFIDMVFHFDGRFYLVDWKSNFLGTRVEDYGHKAMAAAMEETFYILQYHIYTVAIHKYLKLRLPGYNYKTHFGGIYYIFLRGVDTDRGPDFGIYRDRPSEALINEL